MLKNKFNLNYKRFFILHIFKVFFLFFFFLFCVFLAYKFNYLGYPSSADIYKKMYYGLGGKENLDNYKSSYLPK
ncbi:hypothetical protein Sulba_2494 [Sulfurospirillum barnesii SES-3]|uniref:Uncharacterized protein n=1 Tax=Sulfurospirillum barnesii (strain ATCC 700032 / DSM 10660 / SES-3) TaxID=760154 RepID=I3Y0N7_SULBS|nr:hypothetical protein Sulba_2494 [Sulfurospirillum barnesii SES-3]